MRHALGIAVRASRLTAATAALWVLASVTSSCGGKPCPTFPHTDPQVALQYHRSMRSHAYVLRGEAKVDQRGADGRIRGTVMMFIERPDHVRFDAMTQFGPAAILTSDGSQFALNDLRERRYLHGPTCRQNIARLLGIYMSGTEVARFLLGDTPLIDATERAIVCSGDGTYVVTLRDRGQQRQEIELDVRDVDRSAPPEQQRLRLLRSELFTPEGRTVWRATFDDYRVIPDPDSDEDPPMGVAMPFKIRFEHPDEDADTVLRFESVAINVAIPDGAFQQAPRPGLPPELVVCD